MKLSTCIIFITLLCSHVCAQRTKIELADIQSTINNAYEHAISGDTTSLNVIITELELLKKKKYEHYLIYWQAYGLYKLASSFISKDRKASEGAIDKAIRLLDTLSNKRSEDYVLLGSSISFSLNFRPGETAILSQQARANYQKAVELDKDNLRAYFGIGRSDYYRPKQYGGGEIAEANFLKALSLPIQSDSSFYAPTWGKMETYELLVTFYLREGRKQEALIYCKKGLKEFPNSPTLKQHLKTLEQ